MTVQELNQKIEELEASKANLLELELGLTSLKSNIYNKRQEALENSLLVFFKDFNPDIHIKLEGNSIYFRMNHPDYLYQKKLFNIYLRETYLESGKKYDGIDLSYYTTSTSGADTWELKRLRVLGSVSDILIKNQHAIIDTANSVVDKFKEEFNEIHNKEDNVRASLLSLGNQISAIQKQLKKINLFSDGIRFDKPREVALKYNYKIRIVSLKLIDVSKSGLKATAVYEWGEGKELKEEGVNVEKIIKQII